MPNKTQDIQLTQSGFEKINAELNELKETKLPAAIQRVATARSFGDLSENAEYHAAREDLSFLEGKIAELEAVLMHAKVVTPSQSKGKGSADIGAKVTLKMGRAQHTYHIVGEWEADPMNKKISDQSPLGKALIGKQKGDEVELEAPAGKIKYVVMEIE